ncbi:MAG: folate-binding protein YgfZ [Thiomargarita sp.]|nr:folate-binding protein YgfZ [Thiomargarita sp.]
MTNIITDLSHFGLIQVTGDDAQTFLQGQFTNDVRQVTAEKHQLNAWCTHKGRILISFRLLKRDNAYYLLLPQDSVASTIKRLHKYILRSAVKLEDVSDNLPRFGIAGVNSTKILTECLGYAPPSDVGASLTTDKVTVLTIQEKRYIVLGETVKNCEARQVDAAAWQRLDILAGLPQIVPKTAEAFVPQMINFHVIGGVSFKKGCYTGQEVVARMQYLGSLKRRMYLAKIEKGVPQPGDALYISDNDESVGKIVNAVAQPEGGAILLAVIKISDVNSHEIHWQDHILRLMELPYVVQS